MGRENRRNRRDRARRLRQHEVEAPLSQVEFPGIMGWMQRHGRYLFLIGIMFMILSVGAGAFASGLGTPDEAVTPEPTEEAEATDTADATPTEEVINRQYSSAPEMALDEGIDYQAVIRLKGGGEVAIDLLEDEAPTYVNNFVFLAQNQFYEGLTFHRVLPGFVAQAGDPAGTGAGGPGYFLPEETTPLEFERGALSMAKSARGVSGSQFFITLGPAPHLDGEFTVFGWVTEGMGVLDDLTARNPEAADQPRGDVIAEVEIVETEKPVEEAPAEGTASAEGTTPAEGEGAGGTDSPTDVPTGTTTP